ncbi:hypothetical protein KCU92_g6297, partial [Aureobasidium melanogenum]
MEEDVPTPLEYQQRYEGLLELWKNNRMKTCIRATKEFLRDWRAPWYYRAMAHLVLAGSTGDWHLTESHRASAENIYRVTRNQHYPTSNDPSVESNLKDLRRCLDQVQDYQVNHVPSFATESEEEWFTEEEDEEVEVEEKVESAKDVQEVPNETSSDVQQKSSPHAEPALAASRPTQAELHAESTRRFKAILEQNAAGITLQPWSDANSDATTNIAAVLPHTEEEEEKEIQPSMFARISGDNPPSFSSDRFRALQVAARAKPKPPPIPTLLFGSARRGRSPNPRTPNQNRPDNIEIYTSGPSHLQISTPPRRPVEVDIVTSGASHVKVVASQSPRRSPLRSPPKSVPTTPTASPKRKRTTVPSLDLDQASTSFPFLQPPGQNTASPYNARGQSFDRDFGHPNTSASTITAHPTTDQFGFGPPLSFVGLRPGVGNHPTKRKIDTSSWPIRSPASSPSKKFKLDEQSYPTRVSYPTRLPGTLSGTANQRVGDPTGSPRTNGYASYADDALTNYLPLYQDDYDWSRRPMEVESPARARDRHVFNGYDFEGPSIHNHDRGNAGPVQEPNGHPVENGHPVSNNISHHEKIDAPSSPLSPRRQPKPFIKDLIKRFES